MDLDTEITREIHDFCTESESQRTEFVFLKQRIVFVDNRAVSNNTCRQM